MFLCLRGLAGGEGTGYCRGGDHYLMRGTCFPYEFCREIWRTDREDRCEYSNGETFVSGPPLETCPPPPHERAPFCGRGCDECPDDGFGFGATNGRCTGMNEERGLGVCAVTVPCDRENGARLLEQVSDFYLEPAACLVERDGSELTEEGWPVSLETCRAYRARYPGEFACVDPATGWLDVDGE
ncbi:MAG: hypothetical protein AAGE52_24695 [Myxococcota bacterium]